MDENVGSFPTLTFAIIPYDEDQPLRTFSLAQPSSSSTTPPSSLPSLLLHVLSPPTTNPTSSGEVVSTPLRRFDGSNPSVHAYAFSPPDASKKNVRATTLAFACGLHSARFFGDVAVARVTGEGGGGGGAKVAGFCHEEIVLRPDLRSVEVRVVCEGCARSEAMNPYEYRSFSASRSASLHCESNSHSLRSSLAPL